MYISHEGAAKLDIREGVERVVLIGNGAEIDDDDVLMAITIQDVLVLLSSGEDFPVSTSNTHTEQGRCISIFMCMHVYGGTSLSIRNNYLH